MFLYKYFFFVLFLHQIQYTSRIFTLAYSAYVAFLANLNCKLCLMVIHHEYKQARAHARTHKHPPTHTTTHTDTHHQLKHRYRYTNTKANIQSLCFITDDKTVTFFLCCVNGGWHPWETNYLIDFKIIEIVLHYIF